MFDIREDDLSGPSTRDLLALHLAGMHAHSPPGSVYALDLSGLQVPEVTVWTVWRGSAIACVGALRQHCHRVGELKSMRTHPDHLRQGAAAFLLDHMIAEARERGLETLSLGTGSGPAFSAALALYHTRGFHEGEPFAGYARSSFNRFFHLQL